MHNQKMRFCHAAKSHFLFLLQARDIAFSPVRKKERQREKI